MNNPSSSNSTNASTSRSSSIRCLYFLRTDLIRDPQGATGDGKKRETQHEEGKISNGDREEKERNHDPPGGVEDREKVVPSTVKHGDITVAEEVSALDLMKTNDGLIVYGTLHCAGKGDERESV